MKIIGVTGPIGSGKSYITKLFKARGLPTIDADHVYHLLTNKSTSLTLAIADVFGLEVLNTDCSLNRSKLSKIVFSDSEKLKCLNAITHGCVVDLILKRCENYAKKGKAAVVVEVPLMFESGFDRYCDEIICVVTDKESRIKRIMRRNGYTRQEAIERIDKQNNAEYYIDKSTKILYNKSFSSAKKEFERIYSEIFES